MMTYTLIQGPSGEQMLVLDLAGHEDCKVLEENVRPPRLPCVERRNGRWRIKDKDVTRLALLAARPKEEFVQRILNIEDRLKKAGL